MSKQKRFLLAGSAMLALVILAGLTVAAFAQEEAGLALDSPAADLTHELLNGADQLTLASPELAYQGPAPNGEARPFIRQRVRENLAQELAITPQELDEARWTAFVTALNDAVEEGYLAQRVVDRIIARALIRQTASQEELIAAGLGITGAELEAAREEGKTVSQLVDELGLDATTIGQNLTAFLEQLILQASDNGLISDEQAQRILEDEFLDSMSRGLWRPWLQQRQPPAPREERQ